MTLNKAKGRMFKSVGWTWNPIVGCTHDCPYCWARRLTERHGRDFEPKLNYSTLMDKLPDDGTWIFLGSMGDLFCWGFDDEQIKEVLYVLEQYEGSNKFLLQTKNPIREISFLEELFEIQDKVILGTTIETNRETLGRAPTTAERYAAMIFFQKLGFPLFLSLEPLANFDVPVLADWVHDIRPVAVEIGLENYTSHLPLPPEDKIKELLAYLRNQGIPYLLKDNLASYESKELRTVRE